MPGAARLASVSRSPQVAPVSRWPEAVGVVLLSTAFIATAGKVAGQIEVLLALLASACALDLARRETRNPGSARPIACSAAALLMISVAYSPRFSYDLWEYAMIGRIIAVHHASPYLHAANAYAHDPFLASVGPGWRTGTTPYGPLFALHAAAVAVIAGPHPLLYRLGFQGSAALAIGAALLILWRTTRSTAALVLVGLHPVITCAVVNGGHNDAFVGLGLLVAAVNTRRGNYVTAGWSLAAAVLVKATAGLAFLPLVGWAWSRGRWRSVGRIAIAPLFVAAPVMLLTPGVMHSLSQAKTIVITRMSIWNIPFHLMSSLLPQKPHAAAVLLVSLALDAVVAVAACGVLAGRRAGDPAVGILVATAAWLIFGAYVLPWYTVWALPTAALVGSRTRLTWVLALQGAAITASFRAVLPSWQTSPANQLIHIGIPSALAALFAWALLAPAQNPSGATRRRWIYPPRNSGMS